MSISIRSIVSKNQPKKIVVTGASGRIGYQLLFFLADGKLLGDTPIRLFLLEKPNNLLKCKAIQMELEDCNFSSLQEISYTADPDEAFLNADYIFFCGAKKSHSIQEREKIRYENWKNFASQGKALNRSSSSKTQILVVANPCNTNAWVLLTHAPHIPPTNFHALVQLDYYRTLRYLSKKIQVSARNIEKVIVWGNHSPTIVPDIFYAQIKGTPLTFNPLDNNFIKDIQSRGNDITITSGGLSSAGSVAISAIEAMRNLIFPTEWGKMFCSAVYTDINPFGLDKDLIFSMPCRALSPGKYEILSHLIPNPKLENMIKETEEELKEERRCASKCLNISVYS